MPPIAGSGDCAAKRAILLLCPFSHGEAISACRKSLERLAVPGGMGAAGRLFAAGNPIFQSKTGRSGSGEPATRSPVC